MKGYINDNIIKVDSDKYLFDHVLYDSTVEKEFAQDCEKNEKVNKYIKLPSWFKIPTPLGTYNPDWALFIRDDTEDEKLYFVAETKTDKTSHSTNSKEAAKIQCGKAHFDAIGNDVLYSQCGSLADVFDKIVG